MTKNKKILSLLLTASLALSACSSVNTAPEKTFYVLPDNPTTVTISGEPQVSIRYVRLPNYLNQQGIARILPNGQVNVSYTDLWAEQLSQAIPTLLTEDLSLALNQPVETHPLPPTIHVDTVIEVNITRFLGDKENLHLRGSYRLVRPQQLRSYQFEKRVPLADNRTQTLVDAYANAVQLLSQDIAKNLSQVQ